MKIGSDWSNKPTRNLLFLTAIIILFVAFNKIESTKIPSNNTSIGLANALQAITPESKDTYFAKDASQPLEVAGSAYTVGDLDTGEIILSKDQDTEFPIASITKLMTATISVENQVQDALTHVSAEAVRTEGDTGSLKQDEEIKIGNLLYPLLLSSSNDAAEVISRYSGRDIFLSMMNAKARGIGMNQTIFEDPSGLSENNISTTSDLFKLAKYTKEKNPALLQITKNESYTVGEHNWITNNQFLKDVGYGGGKSGNTEKAEQTVISTFSVPLGQSKPRNIAITLLHSPDRYKDVENILNYLKSNIYYGSEIEAGANWLKVIIDGKQEIKF